MKILMEKVLEIKKMLSGRNLFLPRPKPPPPPFLPSRVGRNPPQPRPKQAVEPTTRAGRSPRYRCRVGPTELRAEPPPDRLAFFLLLPPEAQALLCRRRFKSKPPRALNHEINRMAVILPSPLLILTVSPSFPLPLAWKP